MVISSRFSSLCCGMILAALPFNCAKAPPTPSEEPASVAPVKVAKVERMPVAGWTTLLGMTQPLPSQVARISAPVEGRVVTLLQDAQGKPLAEGQEVKAGTVVAQLDTRVIREQLKQAEFTVRQAEIEVKRLETLTANNAAGGTMPLVSRIELARARIVHEDAQSKQKGLEEQIKLFTITSPIDGRLGLMQAVSGQTLAVGAVIVEVVNLNEIDVLCFVPPHDERRLALNQSARIAAPEDGDAAYPEGKVAFIAQQAQADTGNYAVKVRFHNPKLRLRANAVLSLQVRTQPEQERDMVPEAALMEDQDPPAVVIVQEGMNEKNEKVNKARKLRAIVGVRDREKHLVQIIRLEDPEKKEEKVALKGALFVIEGGYGLHDDDLVKIEEEEAK